MQSKISEGTLVQRGYRRNPTGSTKLHIPNFPSTEKRWGLPSCYKPQEVEPLCQDRTLQDGGFTLFPSLIQQEEDWMVELDLKDAYLQVPIHPGQHHLLQSQCQRKTYQFKCLPFGLSAAPQVFTKLLKPVVGFLRQIGIQLIIYLDEISILHQAKDQLELLVPQVQVCQLFKTLYRPIDKQA